MLLTPYRDLCACTFLECMEDYSTSGDLSSSHPRKRDMVRIREVAYLFCNRSPKRRNAMEHPTISLSHAMACPRHRTMHRRSCQVMNSGACDRNVVVCRRDSDG